MNKTSKIDHLFYNIVLKISLTSKIQNEVASPHPPTTPLLQFNNGMLVVSQFEHNHSNKWKFYHKKYCMNLIMLKL